MIDPKKYAEFVNAVTSKESKDYQSFANRIYELEKDGFPTERLLTAAVGLSAEAGEFTEVVKKIIFQGKPVNEDNLFHMKRELGDIMWYMMQACMGLETCLDLLKKTSGKPSKTSDGILMMTSILRLVAPQFI